MADSTTPECRDCGRQFNPQQDGAIVAVGVILGVALLIAVAYIIWAVRRTRHLQNLRQRRPPPESNVYGSVPTKRKAPEENVYETLDFRREIEVRDPAAGNESDDLSLADTVEIRSVTDTASLSSNPEIPPDTNVCESDNFTAGHRRSFSCIERPLPEVTSGPWTDRTLAQSLVDVRIHVTRGQDLANIQSDVSSCRNISSISETVSQYASVHSDAENDAIHFV